MSIECAMLGVSTLTGDHDEQQLSQHRCRHRIWHVPDGAIFPADI